MFVSRYTVFLLIGIYTRAENKFRVCVPESRKRLCDDLMKNPSDVTCESKRNEFDCMKGVADKSFHITAVGSDAAYAGSQPIFGIAHQLFVYGHIAHYNSSSNFEISFKEKPSEGGWKVCYPDLKKASDSLFQLPFDDFEAVIASNCSNVDTNKQTGVLERRVKCLKNSFGKSCVGNYWEHQFPEQGLQYENLQELCDDDGGSIDTECDVVIKFVPNPINPDGDRGMKPTEFQTCLNAMVPNSSCRWNYKPTIILGIDDDESERKFRVLTEYHHSKRKKKMLVNKIDILRLLKWHHESDRFDVAGDAVSLEKFAKDNFLTFEKPKFTDTPTRWCNQLETDHQQCLLMKHLMFYNGVPLEIECVLEDDCLKNLADGASNLTMLESTEVIGKNIEPFAYDIKSEYKLLVIVNNLKDVKFADLAKREMCGINQSSDQ